MNWNPWILPVAMAATLSAAYVLPEAGEIAPSAVIMELPQRDGGWLYEAKIPSQDEINILGAETDFSKATCYRPQPGEKEPGEQDVPDMVDVSIVLSGSDLNTSIHRPERCMPAQGHTILESRSVLIELADGKSFLAKRLLTSRRLQTGREGNGQITAQNVTYYFFVGRNRVTNDHVKRTLIDMKDRLIHGTDQRWAYISVSMMFGELPWLEGKELTAEEADAKLREFLSRFAEKQIHWDRVEG